MQCIVGGASFVGTSANLDDQNIIAASQVGGRCDLGEGGAGSGRTAGATGSTVIRGCGLCEINLNGAVGGRSHIDLIAAACSCSRAGEEIRGADLIAGLGGAGNGVAGDGHCAVAGIVGGRCYLIGGGAAGSTVIRGCGLGEVYLDRTVRGGGHIDLITAAGSGSRAGDQICVTYFITVFGRAGDGVAGYGNSAIAGIVGGCGNGVCGSATAGVAGTTGTAGATACIAGGSGHAGNALTEDQPCVLGIVNKHVAVTLNVLYNIVSAHFPSIHRVILTPLQKKISALDHAGEVGFAPTDITVQQDAGNITFYIVQRFKVVGGIVTAHNTGITGCSLIGTGYLTEGKVVAGGV